MLPSVGATGVGRRQFIEFSAPIFAGGSDNCFRVIFPGQLAFGAIKLGKDPVGPCEQEIVFAVNAIIDVLFVQDVPKISRRSHRRHHAVWIPLPTKRVSDISKPFDERAGVSAGGEAVTENADLTVAKKIVERDKFFCELMMNRRDAFIKESQSRIAITTLKIAQHLIVRAILFDNVENVSDRQP